MASTASSADSAEAAVVCSDRSHPRGMGAADAASLEELCAESEAAFDEIQSCSASVQSQAKACLSDDIEASSQESLSVPPPTLVQRVPLSPSNAQQCTWHAIELGRVMRPSHPPSPPL